MVIVVVVVVATAAAVILVIMVIIMNEKHRTSSNVTTDRVKQPRHSIKQQWHKQSLAPMKSYVKTKSRT